MAELQSQLSSFQTIWKGGYYGGDPRHPTQCTEYGPLMLISSHYAIVKTLIEPNVRSGSRVLEIGPGRGGWTRAFKDATEIYCLDALSAEHNSFWNLVGEVNRDRIKYFQVRDAKLTECPDDAFDFLFSFGAFCHMPQEIREDYFRNMFGKAKSGAVGVFMFADFDKFNVAYTDLSQTRTTSLTLLGLRAMIRWYGGRLLSNFRKSEGLLDKNDTEARPGRFFHGGIRETSAFLEQVGWEVLSPDIGLNLRDPIVVFRKP
ncbi:MAG TPA: class I SAM-dependent methyltransferase [Sphingomicrobium sp.]|jgi:phospholipid N-methyltransferase